MVVKLSNDVEVSRIEGGTRLVFPTTQCSSVEMLIKSTRRGISCFLHNVDPRALSVATCVSDDRGLSCADDDGNLLLAVSTGNADLDRLRWVWRDGNVSLILEQEDCFKWCGKQITLAFSSFDITLLNPEESIDVGVLYEFLPKAGVCGGDGCAGVKEGVCSVV